MTKLNDTQSLLLAHGARQDGSLLPLPDALAGTDRATKAITALVKRGLAEECETTDPAAVSRTDGDLRFGVFATPAGLAAIGIEGAEDKDDAASVPAPAPAPVAPPAPRATKVGVVLALLGRDGGATLPELIAATGWLPHTTRAALTGLRKKGHRVERTRRDGATCYRVQPASAAQ